MNTRNLLLKLENHKKLLSLVSDTILPIKQTLLDDTKDMIHILEKANKEERKEGGGR